MTRTAAAAAEPGGEIADASGHSIVGRVSRAIRDAASLSALLRVGGSAVMVLSMVHFLVDGLHVVNDQQRFFTMLGLTGLLTAAGFLTSRLFDAQRSARAFVALALLSVPVNATVLGALVYSMVPWNDASALPGYVLWNAVSPAGLVLSLGAALVVLLPVTWVSTTITARQHRTRLTTLLFASSALLLVPVRDTFAILLLASVAVAGIAYVLRQPWSRDVALATPMGRMARALLLLPPAIMTGRSLWLYSLDSLEGLLIASLLYVLLRQVALGMDTGSRRRLLANVAGTVVALVVAVLVGVLVRQWESPAITAIAVSATLGALYLDIGARTPQRPVQVALSLLGSSMIGGITLFSVLALHQPLLPGLLTAIAMVSVGVYVRSNIVGTVGLLMLAAIATMRIDTLLALIGSTGWWGMALCGGIAIVLSAIVERYGAGIRLRLQRPDEPVSDVTA